MKNYVILKWITPNKQKVRGITNIAKQFNRDSKSEVNLLKSSDSLCITGTRGTKAAFTRYAKRHNWV